MTRSFAALVCCAILTAGCSSVPPLAGDPLAQSTVPSRSSSSGLKKALDALLPDSLFPPSGIALEVVSLHEDRELYELNSRLLFTPASNQKLFTSAAALSLLGEGYLFATTAAVDTGEASRIILIGAGDPILSTADLDTLALRVSRLAPAGRLWTLAGDLSRFDDVHWGPGWTWDDDPDPSAMAVSPLSVNGNCVDVHVHGGAQPGEPPLVALVPPTSYLALENTGTTAAGSILHPLDVTRRWRERSNVITVSGEILPHDSITIQVNVWQPEWYTLTLFRERLEAAGVRCAGMVLDSVTATSLPVPPVLHRADSIVTYMNKVSDNLSAEALLKTLGAEASAGPGSWAAGTSAVRRSLAGRGIDTTQVVIADGSGVSRYNLTSASVIIRLLRSLFADKEHFAAFYHSLPIAGVDGTIAQRMRGTPAAGNLRAKTGTLSGVSSLSGYVTTADGDLLAFSMIMQNFPGAARQYRQVQDRIGAFLATLRRDLYR